MISNATNLWRQVMWRGPRLSNDLKRYVKRGPGGECFMSV